MCLWPKMLVYSEYFNFLLKKLLKEKKIHLQAKVILKDDEIFTDLFLTLKFFPLITKSCKIESPTFL